MALEPLEFCLSLSLILKEERVEKERWPRKQSRRNFVLQLPHLLVCVAAAEEEDLSKLDHNSRTATTIKISSPPCFSRKLYLKCKQPPFFKSSLHSELVDKWTHFLTHINFYGLKEFSRCCWHRLFLTFWLLILPLYPL